VADHFIKKAIGKCGGRSATCREVDPKTLVEGRLADVIRNGMIAQPSLPIFFGTG
jgi:hypothetical protein